MDLWTELSTFYPRRYTQIYPQTMSSEINTLDTISPYPQGLLIIAFMFLYEAFKR